MFPSPEPVSVAAAGPTRSGLIQSQILEVANDLFTTSPSLRTEAGHWDRLGAYGPGYDTPRSAKCKLPVYEIQAPGPHAITGVWSDVAALANDSRGLSRVSSSAGTRTLEGSGGILRLVLTPAPSEGSGWPLRTRLSSNGVGGCQAGDYLDGSGFPETSGCMAKCGPATSRRQSEQAAASAAPPHPSPPHS